MEQIQVLLSSLKHLIPVANIDHFSAIIQGIYSISGGGITQLNISRYSSISYRSVQRFMALQLPWDKLLVASVVSHVEGDKGPQILAYDDTVEGKAGKETSKVGYFFSSIAGKAIKSVAFGVLGLVSVNEGSSVVVDFEQLEQDKKKALVNKAKKAAKAKAKEGGSAPSGRKAGRPKGSKNKDKIADAKEQSQSLQVLERLLKNVMPVLASVGVVPSYLAADGAFGNLACMLTAQSQGLFLVSKLHCNSALYYPPKAGSKKRKFGERVDFGKLGVCGGGFTG